MSDATPTPAAEDDLPEQMLVRRTKRKQLLDAGEDPYPVVVDRTHTLRQVVSAYDAEALGADVQTGDIASIAGRVIFLRGRRPRRGDGAAWLPSCRRTAWLRPVLPQRDGWPEPPVGVPQ